MHTHEMHDFIMGSLKNASLIRCHLSKVLKEEKAQASWILAGGEFHVRYKDLDENYALHNLGTRKKSVW